MTQSIFSAPAAPPADRSLDGEKLRVKVDEGSVAAAELTYLELQALADYILKLIREDLSSENESQGRSLNW